MINDTSQHGVSKWSRCGETFDHYYNFYKLLLSLFWQNF